MLGVVGCQSPILVQERLPRHPECWEEYRADASEACDRIQDAQHRVEIREAMRQSWRTQERVSNAGDACSRNPSLLRPDSCYVSLQPSRLPKPPFHLKGSAPFTPQPKKKRNQP